MARPKGQTIRFPDEILSQLENLSKKTELSINKIVIKIVRNYFEQSNINETLLAELDPNMREAFQEKSEDELIAIIWEEIEKIHNEIDQLKKDKN